MNRVILVFSLLSFGFIMGGAAQDLGEILQKLNAKTCSIKELNAAKVAGVFPISTQPFCWVYHAAFAHYPAGWYLQPQYDSLVWYCEIASITNPCKWDSVKAEFDQQMDSLQEWFDPETLESVVNRLNEVKINIEFKECTNMIQVHNCEQSFMQSKCWQQYHEYVALVARTTRLKLSGA